MAHQRAKSARSAVDYQERRQIQAKKQRQEDIEALCVVGYASKLFKDDVTAMQIHRGEYLVPWMGDSTLMIDRFDGRGHLSDLSEFDKVHSWNQAHQLSGEEARIEAICDEERYLALHKDLMEEETRREEEQKRIQQSMGALGSQSYYGAVAPSYGGSSQPEEYDPTMPTEDETERAERLARERAPTPEPEQPFIAPSSLHLPSGIETPATQKLNMIIERTAAFITSQNPQMEIVIKAKQANNPQFDFLNYDHYLNPYYRHIRRLIKEGRYVPAPPEEKAKPKEDSDSEDDGYLHPGLLGSSDEQKPTSRPPVRPSVPMATTTVHLSHRAPPLPPATSNTTAPVSTYTVPAPIRPVTALPNRPPAARFTAPSIAPANPPPGATGFLSQLANVAPPVVQPMRLGQTPTTLPMTSLPMTTLPANLLSAAATLPTVSLPATSVAASTGDMAMIAAAYTDVASQLVNAYLSALTSSAPPPPPGRASLWLSVAASAGVMAMIAAAHTDVASQLVNAYLSALTSSAPPPPPGSDQIQQGPTIVPTSTGAAIPGLGDDPAPMPQAMNMLPGQKPEPESATPVIPPPPDIQPIIDKLAQFVAKNGNDFEAGVKLKGDSRFDFIHPWHNFHGYYMQKKMLFKKEIAEREAEKAEAEKAPVSFSIKPRDIDERIGQSALPMEESDSDEELPTAPKPPAGTLDQSAGMNELINLTKQQIALAMLSSLAGAPQTQTQPTFDPSSRPKMPDLFGGAGNNPQATMERPRWNNEKEPSPTTASPPMAVENIDIGGKVSVDYNHGRPKPTPAPPSVPPPPRSRDFSHLAGRGGFGNAPGRPLTYEERARMVRPPMKAAPATLQEVSREELARKQAEKAKLAQAAKDKEKQLQQERKKRAALFMSRMKDGGDANSEKSAHRDKKSSSRDKGRSRERSSPHKSTPKAYQSKADSRSKGRSRSRSRSPKRSSSSLVTSRTRTESPPVRATPVSILKRSVSREKSPADGPAVKGILKAGTIGGILKKSTIEERKARIKRLVESSKKTGASGTEVIEVD